MVMISLITKVTRGTAKDLVSRIILIMFIFILVSGEDAVIDLDDEPLSCMDCFDKEHCSYKSVSKISGDYLKSLTKESCGDNKSVNYCEYLETVYSRGFFTETERNGYCGNACNFLNYKCVKKPESGMWKDVLGYIMLVASGEADIPVVVEDIAPEVYDNWYNLVWHQSSIFLCLIPIMLNQYKHYNLWGAIFFLLFFLLLNTLDIMPIEIAVHNIAICFVCIIGGAGSTVVYESLVTTVIMLICLYCCFLSNIYIQLFAVCVIFFGFCGMLYVSFYRNRGKATVNMLMLLIQVYLLYCQIQYLRETYIEDSLVGITIEMCVNAIAPYGKSSFWYFNSGVLAYEFVGKLEAWCSKPLCFISVFFLEMFAFVSFRACFGAFCLLILRYKFTPGSIICGLYVYMADFYGGIRCVLGMIFNLDSPDGKRMCYAIGSLFLLYREIMYAREFAVLRFVMSSFDALFIQSSYYRASHYLDIHVNFMNKDFPQQGSLPWMDVSVLQKLSRFTSVVKIETSRGFRKGIGCALKFKRSKPVMVTIDHVIGTARKFNFLGSSRDVFNKQKLGNVRDPVVCVDVFGDEFSNAPEVGMLNENEMDDIETLVFINYNEKHGNTVCFVPHFKLNRGLLYATVDLDYGDSGGPCFAVLKSGSVRYCGAVSKGNGNDGGGNIISIVTRIPEVKYDSSDDEMTEQLRSRLREIDMRNSVTYGPYEDDESSKYSADDDPEPVGKVDDAKDASDDDPDNVAKEDKVHSGNAEFVRNSYVDSDDSDVTYYRKRVRFVDDEAHMKDRSLKIDRVRRLSRTAVLARANASWELRRLLNTNENREIIDSFSNKVLWVKTLDFEKMCSAIASQSLDKYAEDLYFTNPSSIGSGPSHDLDQGRKDGPDASGQDQDDGGGGNSKSKRRQNAKRRNKDRAFRKRAVTFGSKLLNSLWNGAVDREEVCDAFNYIVSGYSIDLLRHEVFFAPGGKFCWHYFDIQDSSGNLIVPRINDRL